MLIMNERKLAEEVIKTKVPPKGLSRGQVAYLLVKCYRDVPKVMSYMKEIYGLEFLEEFWVDKLSNILSKILRENITPREIESIPVYEEEVKRILDCDTPQKQKLMFVAYVLARYYDANGWINTTTTKSTFEWFQLANVSMSSTEREYLIGELLDEGRLKGSKKIDNINLQVELAPIGDIVFEVTEFKSLGNFFAVRYKPNHKQCVSCGKIIKNTSPNRQYCPACAKKIQAEQKKMYKERLNNIQI